MKRVVAVVVVLLALSTAALATPKWFDLFSKTYKPKSGTPLAKANCVTCHVKMGSTALNPYGKALKGKPITAASLKSIENQDSDKDKAPNIAEIKAGTLPGDPKSTPKGTPKASSTGKVVATDPTCGMKLDPNKQPPGGKYTYKGVTYYFCSKECKAKFQKNPEKYLKKK